MSIKNKNRASFLSQFVFLLVLTCFVLTGFVQAIATGYTTNDLGLQTGMVASLSLDSNSSTPRVERASQSSSDRVVGVVVTVDQSLVTVGSGSSKVFIENQGQASAYVSDIGGQVKQGDSLVLSSLKGILMKANDATPGRVIGIATDNPVATSTYSYQAAGKTQSTQIAEVKISLSQLGSGNNGSQPVDSVLSKIGRAIVGHDVGEARVLIALIIFLIVLIAEGGIIYGAVSSAITALGRNPLARKTIRSEMFRVIVIAIMVLAVGLGAVYGVLWV